MKNRTICYANQSMPYRFNYKICTIDKNNNERYVYIKSIVGNDILLIVTAMQIYQNISHFQVWYVSEGIFGSK